jgi:predicted GIY-YIG superfamily endonuclease
MRIWGEAKEPERSPERSPERANEVSESKDEVEGIKVQGPLCWWVYILLCRNGTYYVGLTNDLARRWEEHQSGRGCRYTKGNPAVRVVYSEQFSCRAGAEARERQIKGWTRRKKQAVVANDLRLLKRL